MARRRITEEDLLDFRVRCFLFNRFFFDNLFFNRLFNCPSFRKCDIDRC